MRTLLVGVLSVTLIGCSCPVERHAVLDTCTSKPCFYKTAAIQKPTPFKRDRTTAKVVSPIPPQPSDESDKDKIASPITMIPGSSSTSPQPTESLKSTVGTTVNVAASGQASGDSDPVLEKAKTTVASKMEDPASVEFEDLNRAIRKEFIWAIYRH